jgi:hypothetical protein
MAAFAGNSTSVTIAAVEVGAGVDSTNLDAGGSLTISLGTGAGGYVTSDATIAVPVMQ